MDDHEPATPTTVFARRMRQARESRGLTQAQLAERLTLAGHSVTRHGVARIETSARRPSLDEALAIAFVLGTSLAHLLTPDEGTVLAITDHDGLTGGQLRDWLRLGAWEAARELGPSEDELSEAIDVEIQSQLAVLAVALLDAHRAGDEAGKREAARAIERLIQDAELERYGEVGGSGVWVHASPHKPVQPSDRLTRRRRKDKDHG